MLNQNTASRPNLHRLQVTEAGTRSFLSALAHLGARLLVKPVIAAWARFPHAPWPYRLLDATAILLPAVRGVRRRAIRLANCHAEIMSPSKNSSGHAMLYLHGGAFVVGGLNTHRRLISRIVRACGVTSLAVNYRKLPTYAVSAAIEDALDGYRHLLSLGYRPSQIAFAGESAGGFLALTASIVAHQRGLGAPGALVCIAPLTDRRPHNKLARLDSSSDPIFPAASLETIDELIKAVEPSASDLQTVDSFAAAPAHVLAAMPPTLIQVSSTEILRPDAEFAAYRLADAGVAVHLQIWTRQLHVFHVGADVLSNARAAIEDIALFLRNTLAAPAVVA